MGTACTPAGRASARVSSLAQVTLWQLAVMVAFIAIAMVDIQNHGRREPVLVGLAALGYAGFGLICWLAWHGLKHYEGRVARIVLLAGYVFAMGGLFLAAVIFYLLLEYTYLVGPLS